MFHQLNNKEIKIYSQKYLICLFHFFIIAFIEKDIYHTAFNEKTDAYIFHTM